MASPVGSRPQFPNPRSSSCASRNKNGTTRSCSGTSCSCQLYWDSAVQMTILHFGCGRCHSSQQALSTSSISMCSRTFTTVKAPAQYTGTR